MKYTFNWERVWYPIENTPHFPRGILEENRQDFWFSQKEDVPFATLTQLKLNRPHLVESRRYWVMVGWHPPQEWLRLDYWR